MSTPVAGCFADGLYIEGAGWDLKRGSIIRQKPKQLIEDIPVLKIIPIEAHKLKLQVCYNSQTSYSSSQACPIIRTVHPIEMLSVFRDSFSTFCSHFQGRFST